MILGIQTETFEDVKSRKIFHIKTTGENYLLQQDNDIRVHLFKMNVVDSVSIAVLLSLITNFQIYVYVAVAAVIYVGYLAYFNKCVLTKMQLVKKVERKAIEKKSKDAPPIIAFGYILVGLGLVYCMLTNQVEQGTMTIIVIGAMIVSFGLGSFYLYTYYAR